MEIVVKKRDVIWNYIGLAFSLGGNFLILPFLILSLSNQEFSIWNVFISIAGLVTLFDFGFNVTFARSIAYCWSGSSKLRKIGVSDVSHEQFDRNYFFNVLISCKRIYTQIAKYAFLFLIIVGSPFIAHMARDTTNLELYVGWIVFLIGLVFNLLYGYYDAYLRGIGDIASINQAKVYARLIQLLLIALSSVLGGGLIGASLAYSLYGVIFRLIANTKFKKRLKISRLSLPSNFDSDKALQKQIISAIWHNAWRDGLVSLSTYLSTQAGTLIAGVFLPLAEAGAFSLSMQISQAVVLVSGALYIVYQPTLSASHINKNFQNVRQVMSIIVVSYLLFFLLSLPILIWLVQPAILHLKPFSVLPIEQFLLCTLTMFLIQWRNIYTTYIASTNRLPYVKSFVISSVLGVLIAFLFVGVFNIGVIGLILSQVLSQVLFNAWFWPIFVHKELSITFSYMFRTIGAIINKMFKGNVSC